MCNVGAEGNALVIVFDRALQLHESDGSTSQGCGSDKLWSLVASESRVVPVRLRLAAVVVSKSVGGNKAGRIAKDESSGMALGR
jgi:hypothetical protein